MAPGSVIHEAPFMRSMRRKAVRNCINISMMKMMSMQRLRRNTVSLHRSLGLGCARKATSKGVTAAVYISATEVTRSQYCEQVALRGSCGKNHGRR